MASSPRAPFRIAIEQDGRSARTGSAARRACPNGRNGSGRRPVKACGWTLNRTKAMVARPEPAGQLAFSDGSESPAGPEA